MTTLLIDADVTCYVAASGAEVEIEWDPETWSLYGDLEKAKESFKRQLEQYQTETGIDDFKLCYSGSENFRKTLSATYKGGRGRKPVGYAALKEWSLETYPSFIKPSLEADDCLGILATKLKDQVIVTIDKDLLTIPGRMYRVTPNGGKGGEWHTTDLAQADYRFLLQALMGDAVDGYTGIPGVGLKKAEDLLKKHGAVWKTVEDAYLKAGLTKEDALLNARMARILRAEDWDFKNQQVKLWNPPN
jgi:DNA polymerase-1